MVECTGGLVLISTYWNVNSFYRSIIGEEEDVLISTYWNVNFDYDVQITQIQHSFNLNLLECKYHWFSNTIERKLEF